MLISPVFQRMIQRIHLYWLGNSREKHRREERITLNICCGPEQRLNGKGNGCVDVIGRPFKNMEFLLEHYVVDFNLGHARIDSPKFNYKFQFDSSCSNGEILSEYENIR